MVSRVPMGVRDSGQMAMHMARQATRSHLGSECWIKGSFDFPDLFGNIRWKACCKMKWLWWPLKWSCGFAVDLPFAANHVLEKHPPSVQHYGPHYGQWCCNSWGERYFTLWVLHLCDVWTCLECFVYMVPFLFSAQAAFLNISKNSLTQWHPYPLRDISSHGFTESKICREPCWNSSTSCATDTYERFCLSVWGESTSSKWTGTAASCCFIRSWDGSSHWFAIRMILISLLVQSIQAFATI